MYSNAVAASIFYRPMRNEDQKRKKKLAYF